MNNRYLRVFLNYLLISVLLSGAAVSADHAPADPVHRSAASGRANASATVINADDRSCDELRLRTRSSIYNWGAAESRVRRLLPTRCVSVVGQTTARLVVEYRDSNGSTVTVMLDNGAVSISPPSSGSRTERPSADGVQIVDIMLSYD